METFDYSNGIELDSINNVSLCFVCDQITDNGVCITKSYTTKSKKSYTELIQNMLSYSCIITLSDSDVFCQTCKILVEEIDSLQYEEITIREMFNRQIFRKYNINAIQKPLTINNKIMETFDIFPEYFKCKKCNYETQFNDTLVPHYKFHFIMEKNKITNDVYLTLNTDNNYYENELIIYSPEDEQLDEIQKEILNNYCKSCNLYFNNNVEFEEHLEYHFKQKECFDCKNIYENGIDFNNHLNNCCNTINNTTLIVDQIPEDNEEFKFIEENDGKITIISNNCSTIDFNDSTNLSPDSENTIISPTEFEQIENDEIFIINSTKMIFLCPICDYENSKFSITKKHMETVHPTLSSSCEIQIRIESKNQCEICGFNYLKICDHGQAKQKGWKERICSVCNEIFYTDLLLKNHLKKVHMICEYCDKTFNSLKILNQHEKQHKNGSLYQCTECEKTFKTKHGLIYHIPKHTGDYKYFCEICNRGFMNDKFLEQHMGVHSKATKKICDICGTKFSFNSTYRIHRLWHDDPLPYKCTELDCGKKFKHSSYLSVHRRRKHTGERPYKCDYCLKTFVTSSSYKTHLIIHTGKYLYNCKLCNNKGFSIKQKYAQHLATIHHDTSLLNKQKCEYKMILRPEYNVKDKNLIKTSHVNDENKMDNEYILDDINNDY